MNNNSGVIQTVLIVWPLCQKLVEGCEGTWTPVVEGIYKLRECQTVCNVVCEGLVACLRLAFSFHPVRRGPAYNRRCRAMSVRTLAALRDLDWLLLQSSLYVVMLHMGLRDHANLSVNTSRVCMPRQSSLISQGTTCLTS